MTSPDPDRTTLLSPPNPPADISTIRMMFIGIVLGLSAGATVSWLFLSADLDKHAETVNFSAQTALAVLAGASLTMMVLVPFGWFVASRILRTVSGTLTSVTTELSLATQSTIKSDKSTAVIHVEKAIKEGLAWYSSTSLRRWITQTSIAIIFAFGSLIGGALLFRQTLLLSEQNKKLDVQTRLLSSQNDLILEQSEKMDLQTVTSEASRRNYLYTELFSIVANIKDSEKILNQSGNIIATEIDDYLLNRIINFTKIAAPYYTVETHIAEGDKTRKVKLRLSDVQRSPERSQLLMNIISSKIDLSKIKQADFGFSDLRGFWFTNVNFETYKLAHADLGGAQFKGSKLKGANLNEAELHEFVLMDTDFDTATFVNASAPGSASFSGSSANLSDFNGAYFGRLTFYRINGSIIDFTKAIFQKISIRESNINNCNFLRSRIIEGGEFLQSVLRDCKFTDAELRNIAFTDSDLSGADFRRSTMKNVSFVRSNLEGVAIASRESDEASFDMEKTGINFDTKIWTVISRPGEPATWRVTKK